MLKLVENMPVIRLQGLSKFFERVKALDDVTVDIMPGHIVGLFGENGSGKTTLLKILAGLYRDYEGSVEILGEKPSHKTKGEVAYLPDKNSFGLDQTPAQMMELYDTYFDNFDKEKCGQLLSQFGLAPETAFREMSKGMIDKVQLAFVLAREAKVYLLDEPLGGVDSNAREVVLNAILENFDFQGVMIIVTHFIDEMERIFDTVMVLKEGGLAAYGPCDGLEGSEEHSLEEIVRGLSR